MKRKIIGVLGLGIFGRTVAKELARLDQDVIIIDSEKQYVQELADQVTKAVIGDMTDIDFLKYVGIDQCDTVIVATGTNLESAVLAVMNCKKLGVSQIIAKARSKTYEEVLYGIGADLVIAPEREAGVNLVSRLLRNSINDVFHFEGDVSIVEFKTPKKWIGKSITQLNLRQQYDINVIGIRTSKGGPINTTSILQAPLEANNLIVAVTSSKTFEKYDYLGYFD